MQNKLIYQAELETERSVGKREHASEPWTTTEPGGAKSARCVPALTLYEPTIIKLRWQLDGSKP